MSAIAAFGWVLRPPSRGFTAVVAMVLGIVAITMVLPSRLAHAAADRRAGPASRTVLSARALRAQN